LMNKNPKIPKKTSVIPSRFNNLSPILVLLGNEGF
jgi:hypothetical protein